MKRALLLPIALLAFGCVEATDVPKIAGAQLNDEDWKVLGVAVAAALNAEYGASTRKRRRGS
jgi:hypothetical protein